PEQIRLRRFGLPSVPGRQLAVAALVVAAMWLTACAGSAPTDSPPTARLCLETGCTDVPSDAAALDAVEQAMAPALQAARHARAEGAAPAAQRAWLRCALAAHALMGGTDRTLALASAAQANRCTEAFLRVGLAASPQAWDTAIVRLGGVRVALDPQRPSPELQGAMTVKVAVDVPLMLLDDRHVQPGFGVPMVLLTPRCHDQPRCRLLPPEGVFRSATAWLEPAPSGSGADAALRMVEPVQQPSVQVGSQRFLLASDSSSFFDFGAQQSALPRLGVWGLLGGREVGRRAGVFLLEDYDPRKRPLVMVHGLGSSPLTWAKLSNAVWADPQLRQRYQVWHVVYQTNAPLLVSRYRVQQYLDATWRLLDPAGQDPARRHVVLIGHSMGAVISRLLTAQSGDVLWKAAFTVPPTALEGSQEDRDGIDAVFRFAPYPGVKRAIFLSAPHQGSPATDRWFGRLARVLVGRRTPEIEALRRLARDHPQMVQPALLDAYRQGWLNSITTLRSDQPVSRAGRVLMPAVGIHYHTIAGSLPGHDPPGDGVVPLESALLSGADSTQVLSAGHDLYENPAAIAEVIRILHVDLDADAVDDGPSPAVQRPAAQPTRAE
ncbi:MAG TPA: alpha/beta hydrolase, partial [Stenotrophomonas sp.]